MLKIFPFTYTALGRRDVTYGLLIWSRIRHNGETRFLRVVEGLGFSDMNHFMQEMHMDIPLELRTREHIITQQYPTDVPLKDYSFICIVGEPAPLPNDQYASVKIRLEELFQPRKP